MKKMEFFLMSMFMVLLVTACSYGKGTTENELSDYRPMLYVRDNLYGQTADVVNTLPDIAVSIGAIEKVVPQNEPMVQENFTSNTLQTGSKIYFDETTPDIIYVKLIDATEEKYSIYTIIE